MSQANEGPYACAYRYRYLDVYYYRKEGDEVVGYIFVTSENSERDNPHYVIMGSTKKFIAMAYEITDPQLVIGQYFHASSQTTDPL